MRQDLISGASAIVPYVCPKGYGTGLTNSYILYFILLDLLILTNRRSARVLCKNKFVFIYFSLNTPHDVLRMASVVWKALVLLMFLFVCFVFSHSPTISFTRDELLDIRQHTPDNVFWKVGVQT